MHITKTSAGLNWTKIKLSALIMNKCKARDVYWMFNHYFICKHVHVFTNDVSTINTSLFCPWCYLVITCYHFENKIYTSIFEQTSTQVHKCLVTLNEVVQYHTLLQISQSTCFIDVVALYLLPGIWLRKQPYYLYTCR